SDSTASRIRDGFGLGHCRLVCRRVTRWNREWSKFITNLPHTNVGMGYARTIGLRGGALPDREPLARWHGSDSLGFSLSRSRSVAGSNKIAETILVIALGSWRDGNRSGSWPERPDTGA